ncbi:metallophosphoesterase [Polyangium spumosum]|uniref:Metallophosphoesterase n=1 Tax=Polyangium spumosum TaxID=889282 RepID=A0A6N7PZI0_9BACT|nr:metallophosphoesterase [Polyangium spumosum]MRG94101.1 metallophosphoesterase [Polyangium spumosum]
MRRFWTVLFAVTAALHVTFAVAAHALLTRAGAPSPWLFALVLSALLAYTFRGRMLLASADRPVPRLRRLLVEEPYYVHWCALVAALPIWVAGLALSMIAAFVVPAALVPTSGTLAIAAYGLGLALAGWGVFVRRRWVRVRTIDVPIRGLPPAFEGYRIAHLSDLHIGALCPREHAERWADTVRALDVDLVALTGDYVTSGDAFHGEVAALASSLPSRDGVIAVMGNHDYFGDGEALVVKLREAGIVVLRNERTSIERSGAALVIAGVDDTWSRRADVRRAVDGHESGAPLVVLAHDPQLFPDLSARGASLVLSGHTHWGQVAVPFFSTRWNLSARVYRYHADLYREGDAWLYVNPGLGTTGPPVRLGAAPEITILRLGAKSA